MKILAPSSQIKDYFIVKHVGTYDNKATYIAEDFRLDKRVFLLVSEISQKDIYKKLLDFQHQNITSISDVFDEDEQLYCVSKLQNGDTLKKYLDQNTFTESSINIVLNSMIEMFIELKKISLSIHFNYDNLIVDKEKNIIASNPLDIVKYKDDQQIMFELGSLIYFLITKSLYKVPNKLHHNQNYSKALCGLVNRMLGVESSQKFNSLLELKVLVDQSIRSNLESCEPVVCEESSNGTVSAIISFLFIVLLFCVGLYVVLSDKKILKAEEVGKLEVLQFYIAGYMNNSEAQYSLGELYEYGYVVKKDLDEALLWYKKAANNNYIEAEFHLGYLYQRGEGLKKDVHKAIYWYEKAAKDQYKKAYYPLGILYLNSGADKIDYIKAFNYFSKGLKFDDSYSQMAVGYMYENGYGVQKDYKQAFIYYEKAAQANHEIAQLNLAILYHYGKGISVDKNKAKFWYEKAIAQGNEVAKKKLKELNKKPKVKLAKVKKSKKQIKKPELETKKMQSEYVEPQSISYGRYVDRGEFIEDTKTKLYWQKDGRESGLLNFYQAKEYAKNLYLGGVKGWRVPTAKELSKIYPAIEQPFQNTAYETKEYNHGKYRWPTYWTSEVDNRVEDYAYIYQWYGQGGKNNCYASRNYAYVRCVHD